MKQGLLKALTGPGLKALIGTFPCKTLLSIPRGGSVGVTYLKAPKVQKLLVLRTESKEENAPLGDSVVVLDKEKSHVTWEICIVYVTVNIINITGNLTTITHHLHKTTTTTITRGLIMTVLQDCTFIHNPPAAREINIKRMRKN